jgi:hypothetical protein
MLSLKITKLLSSLLFFTSALRLSATDLKIEPNFHSDRWLSRSETLTLRLSRTVPPSEGRLAIFIGATDMSDLFVNLGDSLQYTPSILLLPVGESDVSVQLISPDNVWQEIARFPLKVLTRSGFEKSQIVPTIGVTNSGQIAEGHTPDENQPPRDTYQDFTGQSNLTTEHVRGATTLRSQWGFVGASEQNQALRFSEMGEQAHQIDLSSYFVQLQVGRTQLTFGHVNHGRQRHLINFFGSRGVTFSTELASRVDVSVAAMSANGIVGWDNFAGLSKKDNRIYSGTLGLEMFKSRPGTVRFEASLMDGRMLPFSNFNQGNIVDAEKSRGVGLRLQASHPSQRVRFEGGFARSEFTNPEDPLLSQQAELVPVQATTRNARHADFGVGLLQNLDISPAWQINLNVNLRHERVDPLYRSLTAFARADFMENAIDVQSNIGAIGVQYSHSRSEDNLDDLPSILKTKTRLNGVNVSLPLAVIFTKPTGPPAWLPMMSYGYNRIHQFGAGLPPNSGFSASHVPDQVSESHSPGLDWQGNVWRFGYRLAYSKQDNRQTGRENADFENLNNSFNFGLTPFSRIDINFDLAFESAESKEAARTDKTRRYGMSFNLRPTNFSNLSASISTTHSEDDPNTNERNNTYVNAQGSVTFNINRSANRRLMQGQFFVRYSHNESDSRDLVFGFNNDLSSWTLNTGFSVSLF